MSDTWPANAANPEEHLIGDDAVDVEAAPVPGDDQLQKVAALARRQIECLREVIRLTEELDTANEALRLNRETDLPTLMDQLGLTDFGLAGGHRVEVLESVNASVPAKDPAMTAAAHAWLEANGYGSLIKRRIEIFFDREDEAWAKAFLAQCARRKRQLNLNVKRWVEPQTLSAFVREQLKAAREQNRDPEELAPAATLGIFKRKYAEVSGPAVPKLKKKKG